MTVDWDLYPNFSEKEFRCSCGCGETKMSPAYMKRLQMLRDACGFAMIIISGYRCRNHPEEVAKTEPGPHTRGCASDTRIYGEPADRLVELSYTLGFTGRGINQASGTSHKDRSVHLDDLGNDEDHMRPRIWSY